MRASALPYAAAFGAQTFPPVPEELSRRIAHLASSYSHRQPGRRLAWPKLAGAFAAGVLSCAVALELLAPGIPDLASTAQVAPWIKALADYQQWSEELADTVADAGASNPELYTLHQQIISAVERLPDAQRTVMLLIAVEGLSHREAATVLDVPIGTVMSRLARARLTIGASFGTSAGEAAASGG